MQPLRGWILDVVSATIVAWLLSLAAPSLPGYAGRVAFVTLFGVFAACVSWLSIYNWMSLPVDWTVVMSLELVASWALVGLVLAGAYAPDAVTPPGSVGSVAPRRHDTPDTPHREEARRVEGRASAVRGRVAGRGGWARSTKPHRHRQGAAP